MFENQMYFALCEMPGLEFFQAQSGFKRIEKLPLGALNNTSSIRLELEKFKISSSSIIQSPKKIREKKSSRYQIPMIGMTEKVIQTIRSNMNGVMKLEWSPSALNILEGKINTAAFELEQLKKDSISSPELLELKIKPKLSIIHTSLMRTLDLISKGSGLIESSECHRLREESLLFTVTPKSEDEIVSILSLLFH
jgi:hypothetical protein